MDQELDTEPIEPSRRDAVEAAYDKAEAAEPATVPEPAAAPEPPAPLEAKEAPGETQAQADERRQRDEKGRFAKGSPVKPVSAKAGEQPAGAGKAPPLTPALAAPVSPAVPDLKPPQGWRPVAREKWAGLPREVQEEALRRDTEVSTALSQAAGHRQFAQEFQAVVAPFEGMIRAEGGNPLRAFGELLQTAAALRTAPPAHKAQLVANVIRQFGVPVEAIAAALDGQAPAPGQAQGFDPNQIAQQVEQRILQQLQAQSQQAYQQRTHQEVESFGGGKDYFDVLRTRMGAFLRAAADEKRAMNLDEAYELAFQTHPETAAIWKQREAAKSVQATQAATSKARAAASSIRSRPAMGGNVVSMKDRRSVIEAAWDAADGR